MTLDDLRAEWRARDEALAKALERQLTMAFEIGPRLAQLRKQGPMNWFGWMVYVGFLVGFGLFLSANWGRWEFFVPGLALHVWTIVMGAVTIAEHQKLRALDFTAPVLEIQKRLSALQLERAQTFQWAFLTGQVLWWTPFFLVVCWGVFGINLYALSPFMPVFLAVNLAVGLALIPILYVLARVLGPRLAGSRVARSLLDGVTGRDLAEARVIAGQLARFEGA